MIPLRIPIEKSGIFVSWISRYLQLKRIANVFHPHNQYCISHCIWDCSVVVFNVKRISRRRIGRSGYLQF